MVMGICKELLLLYTTYGFIKCRLNAHNDWILRSHRSCAVNISRIIYGTVEHIRTVDEYHEVPGHVLLIYRV